MSVVRNDNTLTTADMAATGEQQAQDAKDQALQAKGQNAPAAKADSGVSGQAQDTPLFSPDETQGFRDRWDDIQAGFVDEPRQAVEQADTLVAETMKRLAEVFADERARLEQQWDRGDNISTEDLRVAMQRYRSFFDRLLAV